MPEGRRRTAVVVGFAVWCLAALGLSVLFLVVACCLPAAKLENGDTVFGAMLLIFGWCGVFSGEFGWSANVLLFLSWAFLMLGLLLRYLWIVAILLGVAAVVIGATTSVGSTYYTDEAGHHSQIVRLLLGARVWLASMVVPAGAAFVALAVSLLLPRSLPADVTGNIAASAPKD